jgi:N-acyl-D-amino-acid deacylase
MFGRPDGLAGHDANGKPKSNYYSLGWSVGVDESGHLTAGHGGSLPGTNTRLARRSDGRNYAILFNTRLTPHVSRVVSALLPDLETALDDVTSWPSHDLFEE